MLEALQAIHDETIKRTLALEQLTRCATPPPRDALAGIRWHLIRASSQRRRHLLTQVYPSLMGLPGAEGQRVKELRDEEMAMMARSSKHIQEWTIDRIYSDWQGYQIASAGRIGNIRAQLNRERAILFPLLSRGSAAKAA